MSLRVHDVARGLSSWQRDTSYFLAHHSTHHSSLITLTLITHLRSGFVAVVGRPNVGKSTLLNRLVGQKLAITSPRAQSTRDRVTGILTHGDTQAVLVDTPGLLEPTVALQQFMRATAIQALRDADVILHLVEATEKHESLTDLAGFGAPPATPVLVVRTKADLLSTGDQGKLQHDASGEILVSAVTGQGLDELLTRLRELLPEGQFLFPEDDVSTQHLRFFAAELIRETTLEQLDDEVPHAIACSIEEFREDRSPVYIRAIIYVERDSQKRIVIGHAGARIREIGRAARLKIEDLVSSPVFLDLWVKVLPNWRKDRDALRRLGYIVPGDQRP
jgi:GTP-binding protein Era